MMKSKNYFPEVIIGFIVEAVYTMYERISPRTTAVILFSLLLLFGSYKAISSIKRDRKDKDKLGDQIDDPHYFDKWDIVTLSSNPAKLARKALKAVKKGDLLLGLEYSSESRTLGGLKPKLERKVVELINDNYNQAIRNSKADLLARFEQCKSVDDSVYAIRESLKILEQRSAISSNLLKVPQKLSIESESQDFLDNRISETQEHLNNAELRAAEFHYQKGLEILNASQDIHSAKKAYNEFGTSISMRSGYKDAPLWRRRAKALATVTICVQIANQTNSPPHGDILSHLYLGLEGEFKHSMKNNPFVRLVKGDVKAPNKLILSVQIIDVSNQFSEKTKVETQTITKEIEVDGVKKTVEATATKYLKLARSQVKATFLLSNVENGQILISESDTGLAQWDSPYASYTGSFEAIKGTVWGRWVTFAKKLPDYPKTSKLEENAAYALGGYVVRWLKKPLDVFMTPPTP